MSRLGSTFGPQAAPSVPILKPREAPSMSTVPSSLGARVGRGAFESEGPLIFELYAPCRAVTRAAERGVTLSPKYMAPLEAPSFP